MSILVLTIFMVIVAIFLLFMAYGKIKDLENAKANLKNDNSKLSDALRRKGIEVAQFEKKFKRLGRGKDV